jgi:hypothetical protein
MFYEKQLGVYFSFSQECVLISLKCIINIFKLKTIFLMRNERGLRMRYTFQDSTDFPVQKDFIQDLQDFIAISKEVIPLEKSALHIKAENEEKVVNLEKRIQEIDRFEQDIRACIENRTPGTEESDIFEIKARILETVSSVVLAKKSEEYANIDRQNKLDLIELQQLDESILSILSPFFETSIYGAKSTYYATLADKILGGKQVSFVDGIQYEFDLNFTRDTIRVKDLQNMTLPIWSKKGILTREKKVKYVDISDYYIKNIEYEGNNLRAVLEDKDSENSFVISAEEKTFLITYKDFEITGDKELEDALNKDSVEMFLLKLREFFTKFVVSKRLRLIKLDGKNVIAENKILDCLMLIAAMYGQLVAECIEKGYTKGEITIKIEEPEGFRTEKYLEKSEILQELSALGSEGEEIAVKLKVTET